MPKFTYEIKPFNPYGWNVSEVYQTLTIDLADNVNQFAFAQEVASLFASMLQTETRAVVTGGLGGYYGGTDIPDESKWRFAKNLARLNADRALESFRNAQEIFAETADSFETCASQSGYANLNRKAQELQSARSIWHEKDGIARDYESQYYKKFGKASNVTAEQLFGE